jgi:hypothetical protein
VVHHVATLLSNGATLAGALIDDPNNFGDTRSGGLAGPVGLLIILLLAIATVLLIRNMNSRLRRLPDRFPSKGADDGPDRGSDGQSDDVSEGP